MNAVLIAVVSAISAQTQGGGDIPKTFTVPETGYDYEKREVMIPMRDGVRLHTVIVIPKGAKDAPIVLTRTPYNASKRAARNDSPRMLAVLPLADEVFVSGGYIRAYQDVRGKYGSEGDYIMTKPVRGPLNKTATDHSTDAYDTIDWLVKNLPQSNGRVGMIGSSYEGFTVAMALLDPHPALKAAVPESPMVDGWMGDDWFHYGAFRQVNLDYFTEQTTKPGEGDPIVRSEYDDYEEFRRAGSAGDFARLHGLEQLPGSQKLMEHPSYDSFWQGQALDKLVAQKPSAVPTMWLQGLWDQEDMWGAIHCYLALKKAGQVDHNYLVMGPWRHSQVNREGYSLGPLRWEGDTTAQFRRDVLLPFFDQYLKNSAPKANTPKVLIYNTGENHWDRLPSWPLACDEGCPSPMNPLYLENGFSLGFNKPSGSAADSYVSDPEKPVPYVPRPVRFLDGDRWGPWLVTDQRAVEDRTDVLAYSTPVLTSPVRISGAPVADLFASITGTDADWVVILIEVYPDEVPSQPEMGGYELALSMLIFSAAVTARASSATSGSSRPENLHALPLHAPHHKPRFPARPPDHGPDPIELVPALRPESTQDLRSPIFSSPNAWRLREIDAVRAPLRGHAERGLAADRAVSYGALAISPIYAAVSPFFIEGTEHT